MEELPPKIPAGLQPKPKDVSFDLDLALSSVVSVRTEIPDDAFTAGSLGTERRGHGVVIADGGLVLTIGYLIIEAASIWMLDAVGRAVALDPRQAIDGQKELVAREIFDRQQLARQASGRQLDQTAIDADPMVCMHEEVTWRELRDPLEPLTVAPAVVTSLAFADSEDLFFADYRQTLLGPDEAFR